MLLSSAILICLPNNRDMCYAPHASLCIRHLLDFFPLRSRFFGADVRVSVRIPSKLLKPGSYSDQHFKSFYTAVDHKETGTAIENSVSKEPIERCECLRFHDAWSWGYGTDQNPYCYILRFVSSQCPLTAGNVVFVTVGFELFCLLEDYPAMLSALVLCFEYHKTRYVVNLFDLKSSKGHKCIWYALPGYASTLAWCLLWLQVS